MIDKTIFAVPHLGALTDEVKDLIDAADAGRTGYKQGGWLVLEPSIPLAFKFHPRYPTVKNIGALALRGVSQMDATAIRTVTARAFREPDAAKIVRLDVAVDVPLPVKWFRENVYVPKARNMREWEKVEYTARRGIETVQWGSPESDRSFIVYDKLAERTAKNRPTSRWADAPLVSRLECRMRDAYVPASMRTMPDLLENILRFDPFTEHQFFVRAVPGVAQEHNGDWDSVRDSMLLSYLIRDRGIAGALLRIRQAGGDVAQFRQLLPTVAADTKAPDFNALFRASVEAQLSGKAITTGDTLETVEIGPGGAEPQERTEFQQHLLNFLTTVYPNRLPAPSTIRTRASKLKRKRVSSEGPARPKGEQCA